MLREPALTGWFDRTERAGISITNASSRHVLHQVFHHSPPCCPAAPASPPAMTSTLSVMYPAHHPCAPIIAAPAFTACSFPALTYHPRRILSPCAAPLPPRPTASAPRHEPNPSSPAMLRPCFPPTNIVSIIPACASEYTVTLIFVTMQLPFIQTTPTIVAMRLLMPISMLILHLHTILMRSTRHANASIANAPSSPAPEAEQPPPPPMLLKCDFPSSFSIPLLIPASPNLILCFPSLPSFFTPY
ncbi:hypothetical protein B0H19DRAFT_1256349 [Mycena capillaripes]|nr:hypothetical protein B0H19DRAFT_1256349 [Mycena capillaripes]